jgi:L-lactate dehydrogenase complex protein LldE
VKVALFATCVVDQLYPAVAHSTARVLGRHGCEVSFPRAQVCCAQPAFNSGHFDDARRVASSLLAALSGADQVVTPSGSCAAMIHHNYARLFEGDAARLAELERLLPRLHEFSQFMVNVLGVERLAGSFPHAVTFHPSCHGARLLGVKQEPLQLLRAIPGLELRPLANADDCCGFGGTFAVKLPEISAAIADEKLSYVEQSGARYLVGTDLGCLMHLAGRMRRRGLAVEALHVAEVVDRAEGAPAGVARCS